ncbi:MAG: hypothetical protein IJ164_07595 [Duodenibacillus sp.]|nr:hypothetical protein [Duodenibacillus sp.]HBC70029.1 hypothetical protein [Sutterella sp.]
MNQTTKYGLIFLGGIVVGALGAAAVSRGNLNVKPLVSDLLAGGLELKDKVMAGVEGIKEDVSDVVAEAQVKNEQRKASKEQAEAAQTA